MEAQLKIGNKERAIKAKVGKTGRERTSIIVVQRISVRTLPRTGRNCRTMVIEKMGLQT